MKKYFSVDRILESGAVCIDEKGKVHIIEKKRLPPNVVEGTILSLEEGGRFLIDVARTQEERKRIRKLENSLLQK
ncbi:MAG: DUF3006 domain-containing protein [Oscillospiraceae bacterium]|jgi:hypothetical protein|nr:DUF3006 domain-containing protein [Oscillospiraceae bacterium]